MDCITLSLLDLSKKKIIRRYIYPITDFERRTEVK